jgi:hypothetical protein
LSVGLWEVPTPSSSCLKTVHLSSQRWKLVFCLPAIGEVGGKNSVYVVRSKFCLDSHSGWTALFQWVCWERCNNDFGRIYFIMLLDLYCSSLRE